MTDRELLEKAAKAAGYELSQWPDEKELRAEVEPNWRPIWNPLTSDGDALRLAVKLGLCINFAAPWTAAYAGSVCAEQFSERHGDDPGAATRRAIVRAAAACKS